MAGTNHLFDGLRANSAGREKEVFAHLPSGTTVTYGSFFEGAQRLAGRLVGLGLVPGERVAVQVSKSIEALQLYVGTVLAGGVFLPLNTAYTDTELAYFFGNARPKIAIVDPKRAQDLAPVAAKAGIDHLLTLGGDGTGSLTAQQAEPIAPVARTKYDLAAILYTSGTTGRPKGAMLSHGNLRSNSEVLARAWGFSANDVLIHALPIFHTHGLFVATNVALLSGAAIRFFPGFDAPQVLCAMANSTALMGVPTFYTRLLNTPGLEQAAQKMRLFVSGSAPLLAETHRAWESATGHRILERYGMTETNMITSNPLSGDRRAGTVGKPLEGVAVRIVEDGQHVPDGAPGIIEVKGPNVFQGYWEMPHKTAEEFSDDGFFITGDIGIRDADGYISIVGRAKDLIISGGYNIYPKEVETEIDAVPGVLESAVIGVPHKDFGEGVVAVIVRSGQVSADEIGAAIGDKLARYKQPKLYEFADELPRNAMGKVQKNVLREQFGAAFS